MKNCDLSGWGRYPRERVTAYSFENSTELRQTLAKTEKTIAHGKGRSYGDSALNSTVVLTNHFNRFLQFDEADGTLVCESGTTLEEIVQTFLRRGWFLPVTPGTKFVTVGGALAADVHGKNHHLDGAFSRWVNWFDLMLPSGDVKRCSREMNPGLFLATSGGMGLTGVILDVALQLRPVSSAFIDQTTLRAKNLESILELFEEHNDAAYSVAWIDCLARGNNMGRSVLMLGEHSLEGGLDPNPGRTFSVPIDVPGFALNSLSMRIFNEIYFRSTSERSRSLVSLDSFFYPLDRVGHWNRLYGQGGFTQYQFVVPKETGTRGLATVLQKTSALGFGSFLAVLKAFGPANDNYLSFPMEGYTLALDFKIQKDIFPLLEELDRIVLDFGGRLYLAKDARMKPDVLRAGYPGFRKFTDLREELQLSEKFESLQSKRLKI